MNARSILLKIIFGFLGILMLSQAWAAELDEAMKFWETKVLLCEAQPGGVKSPSKQTGDPSQPCDDGDMTLFNGLLCMAGDERGCLGVAEAQDPVTGQWYRSPRIRAIGYNDRGDASFSPDMALGVQLYLIKKKDTQRAQKWLAWLHNNVACSIGGFGTCLIYALPRFCTDGDGQACTMRPGDAAALASTVDYLQKNAGMEVLPDGRLRGYLGTMSGLGPFIEKIDSEVNKGGYSQHLVGVSILVYRAAGNVDARLQEAATKIASKNPANAFFIYLSEGKSANALQVTLEKCPKNNTILKQPFYQWQWEREEADKAWEHTCFWDCIFMAKMLGV